MFFGYPNKELISIVESIHQNLSLSDAEIRQNRVYRDNISNDIIDSFLLFMNSYKSFSLVMNYLSSALVMICCCNLIEG